ncbi:MAG: hypothetical protein ACFFDI_14690 [Promethearchaeota archaeon]
MDDPILDQIDNLNAEEIVKDLLRSWSRIRTTYQLQIRRFRFKEQDKKELGQLAQSLYQKYNNPQSSAQNKVVWDEGIFNQFFSVWLYGKETYPLFAYPYHLLIAESLNSNLFNQILESLSSMYITLERFSETFWQERWSVKAKLSGTDLKILKEFFKICDASSSIGFPNTLEIWRSDLNFSKSTAQARYQRLLALEIIIRRSIINYAKLGLIPLLKIYNQNDTPSETELLFSTWGSSLPPDKFIRLLVIPERSSFWYNHSARDVYVLQFRCSGVNINLFDGIRWRIDVKHHQLDDGSSKTTDFTLPQWKMDFTSVNRFPFVSSDLNLLTELVSTPERQIKYLGSRAGLKNSGYVPKRLQQLRNAGIFQTYFGLYNVGLNKRYSLWSRGEENELQTLYHWIRLLPRYFIFKSDRGLFALTWLSEEVEGVFLERCSFFQETLREFSYGYLDYFISPTLSLPNLWNEEKEIWESEPEL